jgi:hypothetical protein
MGEVYGTTDTRLRRQVPIKHHNGVSAIASHARLIASLNHPNFRTLFDVGPNYLVMESIDGPTLTDRIRSGPLDLKRSSPVCQLYMQTAPYPRNAGWPLNGPLPIILRPAIKRTSIFLRNSYRPPMSTVVERELPPRVTSS